MINVRFDTSPNAAHRYSIVLYCVFGFAVRYANGFANCMITASTCRPCRMSMSSCHALCSKHAEWFSNSMVKPSSTNKEQIMATVPQMLNAPPVWDHRIVRYTSTSKHMPPVTNTWIISEPSGSEQSDAMLLSTLPSLFRFRFRFRFVFVGYVVVAFVFWGKGDRSLCSLLSLSVWILRIRDVSSDLLFSATCRGQNRIIAWDSEVQYNYVMRPVFRYFLVRSHEPLTHQCLPLYSLHSLFQCYFVFNAATVQRCILLVEAWYIERAHCPKVNNCHSNFAKNMH